MASDQERANRLDRALAGQLAASELDEELASLLNQAHELRRLEPPHPSRAFLAATRHRLQNRIEARTPRVMPRAEKTVRLPWPWLRRPSLALAGLALAILLLVSGTGVAFASSASLPGDPLYPVKQGFEQARLALTIREKAQLQLLHQYANRRLEEIEELQQSARAENMPAAISGYEQAVEDLVSAVQEGEDSQLVGVQQSLTHHQQVLQEVLQRAPDPAVPGLENALEKASQSQQVLEALKDGRSPSDEAPGQLKKEEVDEPAEGRTPPGQEDKSSPGPPGGTPPGQQKKSSTPGPPPGKGPPDDRGGGRPDNP